jgi:murein DD-endopeptidase MepM/ murein hydrolase activator NlpD
MAGLLWAALAGAEVLYRLPWPEGQSYMFTQVPDGRITSHFTKATLYAVDIAMPAGMTVLSARAGVVEAVEAGQGAEPDEEPATYEGNFVRVRHADGTAAVYAHLEYGSVAVAPGEAVEAGQLLARSGASGDAARPHLHFAVTRVEVNSSGWPEEVSLPVTFYVGVPAVAFAPRAAMTVKSNYSGVAEPPRTPLEAATFAGLKRPAPGPDDEAGAWLRFALWLAAGVAGMAWFWRFSMRS